MARLIEIGGDPGAKDVARVLRVPGFYHQKKCAAKGQTGEPYLVQIVERNESARYTELAIAAAFPAPAPRSKSKAKGDTAVDWASIEAALRHIPPGDRTIWRNVGMALHSTGAAQARRVWDSWARTDCKFDPDDQQKTWDSFTAHPNGIALGTLFHIARTHGWRPVDSDDVITQDSIAVAFAEKFAGELRYCHSTKGWYLWTGFYWQRDETDLAFQYARQLGRRATAGAEGKTLKEIRKVAFAGGVERFARGDRALAVTAFSWDADPFLLGTPGGTVDLKTGELRPSNPTEGITKITSVAPADAADCPLWLKFLFEATAGDLELMRFLQQWAGYSLTGDTREEVLVFAQGDGGNGKGVFTKTLSSIWGDYAVTAVMDMFMTSHGEKHTTDIAMLRGARMVLATETEQGRAWSTAKINELTGGDRVTGRFMRCDNFTFQPQLKLTLSGNFTPDLHAVNDAARRRMKIVAFPYKPPRPDLELKSKLETEWPAILRWAIEGCLDWQKNGLILPKALTDVTEEYFAEQDTFRHWLNECCDVEPGNNWKNEKSADLYKSWRTFAERVGELPGTAKAFAGNLKSAGIKSKRGTGGVRMYEGIRLVRANPHSDDGAAA